MKDYIYGALGLGAGAVGCVVYFIFYAVIFALMLLVGFKILSWIF